MNIPLMQFDLVEYPLLNVMLNLCIIVMAVCLLLCLIRLAKGPTAADRVIAADAISCDVMILVVVYSLLQDTTLFMPAALVTALLGFLGMVGMSKYLTNRNVVYPMHQHHERTYKEVKRRESHRADRH